MFMASRKFNGPFVKLYDMYALEIMSFCSYKFIFTTKEKNSTRFSKFSFSVRGRISKGN